MGARAKDACDGGELTLDSPAGVLFPSRAGREGQCAIALVTVLVDCHNSMLLRLCESVGGAPLPAKVTPSSELSVERQLVVFDGQKMHLLLLANSEYEVSVEGSAGTEWKLKVKSLEMQVIQRSVCSHLLLNTLHESQ